MTVAALHRPACTPAWALSVTSRVHGCGNSRQTTVVVRGQVDASNAKWFADAVCEAAAGGRRLTVDLSELEFMALDGVASLHAINARMARDDVSWHAVPGYAVSRVLRLCDPEQLIPIAAPQDCRRHNRPSLRLVAPA